MVQKRIEMATELLRESLIQFFTREFEFNTEFVHGFMVYNIWDKEVQKYIWLMRQTVFEGELPTIRYLIEMLEQNPGLPSRTIQMLIRLFFIALSFRLNARGYFETRDAATEALRIDAWDTVMDRMEYLIENSHNQDFLYNQLVDSYNYFLHAVHSQTVQQSVIQPAIRRDETNFQSMRARVLRNSRLPPELQRTIVERLTLDVIENGGIVHDAVIAYVNAIVHP